MASVVCDAIKIETDDGSGLTISSASNSAIGLLSGVFYLVTGRPGLTGSQVTSGDTTLKTWYQDILADDETLTCSRSANIAEAGTLANASTFSFSILNTALFWNTLAGLSYTDAAGNSRVGLNLARCRVTYYYVTNPDYSMLGSTSNTSPTINGISDTSAISVNDWISCSVGFATTGPFQVVSKTSNSITLNANATSSATTIITSTWYFTQRWQGVVDEQPFSELYYRVRCIDTFKSIFQNAPPIVVDDSRFPTATKDSLNKPIPVAIGRVSYSPLAAVSQSGTKTILTIVGGVERYICASTNYDAASKTVTLKTDGVGFRINDSRLVGSFLLVIAGGIEQALRIISNTATSGVATSVVLEDSLDLATNYSANSKWSTSNTTSEVWYFEVVKYSSDLLASTKPIYQFLPSKYTNTEDLFIYDEAAKDFTDISDLRNITSLTNVDSTGFPGIQITAASLDSSGKLSSYYRISPIEVKFSANSFDSNTVPGSGLPRVAPNLYDGSSTTYYSFTSGLSSSDRHIGFEVKFSEKEIQKTWDDLYILIDFDTRGYSGGLQVNIEIYPKDFYYTRQLAQLLSYQVNFLNPINGVSGKNFLPAKYYPLNRSDVDFFAGKSNLSIQSIVDNVKKSIAYNVAVVDLRWNVGGSYGGTLETRIYEFGFVGKKVINVSTDQIYASIVGEINYTTWNSRRTAAAPIYILPDALEHLVRNYCYNYPYRQANTTYVKGALVRPNTAASGDLDNGHYYICSVAGKTGTGSPSWPTASGGTVTDGTVIWKELGTIQINEAHFDTLANTSERYLWYIGRTLTEKTPVEDLVKELAVQGFLGVYSNYQGKLSAKAWRENTTPLVTFDETSINAGTLSEVSLTPFSQVYNDILVKYDYNPGSQKFNKQIAITRVDQPSFPDSVQPIDSGTYVCGVGGSNTFSIATINYIGTYYWTVFTSSPHLLVTGDYVWIFGNTDGYNQGPVQVEVANDTQFNLAYNPNILLGSSTSGTINKTSNASLLWKSYVSGIKDFALAKQLWDQCHDSYLYHKSAQKLPDILSDCFWFIDPAATDPSGNLFWTDLASAGDEHPAVWYARNLCEWASWQKKQITFEVPRTTANMALELFDPCNFSDQKLTNNSSKLGWITEIVDLPASGSKPRSLKITLTLNPEGLTTCNFLYDTSGAVNTLTDTSGATDTLTDTPC